MSESKAEEFLRSILFRASCPSEEELGNFYLDKLERGRHLAVALHLRECPHCAAELAMFAVPEDEMGLFQDVKSFLQRVLWARPSPTGSLAWARGALKHHSYTTEGVEVTLETDLERTGYQRYRLLGQIEPADVATTVELWQEEDIVAESPVDELGYFQFDRLQPVTYRLCLKGRGTEIWLDQVNVT